MGMKSADPIGITGRVTILLRDARTGRVTHTVRARNITCVAGRSVLAALLNGETTYGGSAIPTGASWLSACYGAVGTGIGTPAASDTAMFSELARTAVAFSSRSTIQATLSFFFATSQANGTIKETALFLLASGTAGSGYMLSHATVPSLTKTNAETMTLQIQITFNS
jgi:hypothetical protein